MKQAFPPIIGAHSKVLFLGTMPGERSLNLQQYYGNRGNQFWKLLFEVLDIPFSEDYNDRQQTILEHNFALWDVLQYCDREGSLDSSIRNEIPNDFTSFYRRYPAVQAVLFTSKNAAAYYNKYVGRQDGLYFDVLPSPSGANATMRYHEKLAVWQKKILPLITR